MSLSLADLALRGGERYERVYSLEFEPIVLGGEAYRVLVPDGVDVAVDRVTGGYLVSVVFDARVYGPCTRCLGEAVVEVHADEQEFAPTAKDGWHETDTSDFITDLVVDIDGLAREALVLALPAQLVCGQQCKGLCTRCGKDLNKGPCGCGQETIDERWNRLQHLKLTESAEGASEGSGKTGPP